jgi:hypothetical protein
MAADVVKDEDNYRNGQNQSGKQMFPHIHTNQHLFSNYFSQLNDRMEDQSQKQMFYHTVQTQVCAYFQTRFFFTNA